MGAASVSKEDAEYIDTLVKRAQAGDNRAFDLLVKKYRSQVVRSVARFSYSSLDCDDIAQETFIRAYRGLRSFRRDAVFSTWIYRIAINVAKSAYLSDKKERALWLQKPTQNLELAEQQNDTSRGDYSEMNDMDTPELILISKQTAQRISSAIDGMPPIFRRALILREIDKMSYRDAAKVLACPIGTVRSRVFRAKELLLTAREDSRITYSSTKH